MSKYRSINNVLKNDVLLEIENGRLIYKEHSFSTFNKHSKLLFVCRQMLLIVQVSSIVYFTYYHSIPIKLG